MSDITYDEFPNADDYPSFSQQLAVDQAEAQKQAQAKANLATKERIKTWMAACLIGTAGFIDLIQALLTAVAVGAILAPIISIGASFLFIVWFWMLGVSFVTSPKKLAAMVISAVVGLIPVVDALPELTLGIITIVLLTRSEDKGGIIGKAAGLAQGEVSRLKKYY